MDAAGIPSPYERISASYKSLADAAAGLNAASDSLGQLMTAIDDALARLNLGVSAWITFVDMSSDGPNYHYGQVGYAKISHKWGIGIRTVEGHEAYPERDDIESWLFNDAPRTLRVGAVEKLPELLDGLARTAIETTDKLKSSAEQAGQFVKGVKFAATEIATARRK
jgi:hypothetical protein